MCRSKRNIMYFLAVVVYIYILAVFGPPWLNKKITAKEDYENYQKTRVERIFYIVRNPVVKITTIFLLVAGGTLLAFQDRIFSLTYAKGRRDLAFGFVYVTIGIYGVFLLVVSFSVALDFLIMKLSGHELLKESARSDFVFAVGVVLLLLICMRRQIEWLQSLKKWEISTGSISG